MPLSVEDAIKIINKYNFDQKANYVDSLDAYISEIESLLELKKFPFGVIDRLKGDATNTNSYSCILMEALGTSLSNPSGYKSFPHSDQIKQVIAVLKEAGKECRRGENVEKATQELGRTFTSFFEASSETESDSGKSEEASVVLETKCFGKQEKQSPQEDLLNLLLSSVSKTSKNSTGSDPAKNLLREGLHNLAAHLNR